MNKYLSPRKGLIAFLILFSGFFWVEFFGNPFAVFTTMIGVLLFSYYDISAPLSCRLKEISIHGSISVLLTPAAILCGNNLLSAIIFLFATVLLSSLAMTLGSRQALSLFMTNAWLMIALARSGDLEKAITGALCLLGGGCVYVLFSSILRTFESVHQPDASNIDEKEATQPKIGSHLSLDSPIFQFALVRSISVSAALFIGWKLFDLVPFWMAYTVFFVTRPGLDYSLRPAIDRGVGTLVGTLMAFSAVWMLGTGNPIIEVLLVIALSICIAEGGARYFLFVALFTFALLLYLALSGTDNIDMGNKRLMATLLGIIIALVTTTVLKYLPRRSKPKSPG